jgi:hypothetical protein
VGKKQSLTVGAEVLTVAKKVQGQPYDEWDKESIDYHKRYAAANAAVAGGNAFGLSDLNYYGSFINAGGASFWQPYFVGAGWSPYANGVYAFYPGAGYSWVSPYPWGWLPYHSGTWSFFQGYGWGWQPGGAFNGLNNVATNGTIATGTMPAGSVPANGVGKNPMHSPIRSAAAPAPPTTTGGTRQSLVMSSEKPIVYSRQDQSGNFVFQKDSAGLGVPRGSLGNLNHVNNDVGRHGSASMPVYAAGPNGAEGNGNFHGANRGPATLRPAYGGEGSPAMRGNEAAAAAHQGGYERTGGVQGVSPSSRGGGGGSPAAGGGASAGAHSGGTAGASTSGGGGAAHSSAASPR